VRSAHFPSIAHRIAAGGISSYYFIGTGAGTAAAALGTDKHMGRSMAIKIEQTRDGNENSLRFQPVERLKVYLFGVTVLFASFGAGEAVYRVLFSEFDGTTDRIPVEVLFGLVFAWACD
jgi:hypothetical protein